MKDLKELTPMQYHVTQENGTEPPFNNEYDEHFEKGIYVDVVSGEVLFLSTDKFNSGCGWPAFRKTAEEVVEKQDLSHGMRRIEVRSKKANSHLGHLFHEANGPRYCINSAAMTFIPVEEMEAKGYGAYIEKLEEKADESNESN